MAFLQQKKGMKDPEFLEDNDISLSLNLHYHFKVIRNFPLACSFTAGNNDRKPPSFIIQEFPLVSPQSLCLVMIISLRNVRFHSMALCFNWDSRLGV